MKFYSITNKMELIGYTDSDWTSDTEERKRISSFVFDIGLGTFSWSSKKNK